MLSNTEWPAGDETIAADEIIEIGIQVNGKLRDKISLPRDCDIAIAEARALESPAVIRHLDNRVPKKVIVVRNRIINVVI